MKKGRPVIDIDRCKGCGLCPTACPQKIIVLSEETNQQGSPYAVCIDEDKCTACTFCAVICPDCAIEIIKQEEVS